MAEPHVVSALIQKRRQITGQIEQAETTLRQLVIDLDNLDHTLRLFAPDIDLEEIRPKPLPPRHQAFRGEVTCTPTLTKWHGVRIIAECRTERSTS